MSSLPLFITGLKPVSWSQVSLSNLNPSQKEVKLASVKNKTADDVSDGTEPDAELHLNSKLQDHSVTVKNSELLDYTISIDANNAAKVDDETELTKIKAKSSIKEQMLGAIVFNADKTANFFFNPFHALRECAPVSEIQLVSYDAYVNKDWNATSLSQIRETIQRRYKVNGGQVNENEGFTNYIVVQYHGQRGVNTSKVLEVLKRALKCPELTMEYHNNNVTSGKIWFSNKCETNPVPNKLPMSVVGDILNELAQYGVNDVYVVNRRSIEGDQTV